MGEESPTPNYLAEIADKIIKKKKYDLESPDGVRYRFVMDSSGDWCTVHWNDGRHWRQVNPGWYTCGNHARCNCSACRREGRVTGCYDIILGALAAIYSGIPFWRLNCSQQINSAYGTGLRMKRR